MSKPKVLLADDSATIQKVFELAFENEGVEIVVASDGASALEMAFAIKPGMIIADVDMPQMDGFELCKAIKSDGRTSLIPVYLLSSSLDDFDEEKSNAVMADGHFEKPFRSEEMVTRVKDVIETSTAAFVEAPDDDLVSADIADTDELVSDDTVADTDELVSTDDDTFDDIDVQLDTLMESLAEEDAIEDVEVSSANEETEETKPVPVKHAVATPTMIELTPDSLLDATEIDDDDMDAEVLLSYEELSDDDEIETTVEAETPEISNDVTDKPNETSDELSVDTIADDIIDEIGDDFSEKEDLLDVSDLSTDEPSTPVVEIEKELDTITEVDLGETELVAEAMREFEAIGDPALDETKMPEETEPAQTAVDDPLGKGIATAFETLRTIGLQDVIEGATKETAGKQISEEDIRKTIELAIKSAIDEMKPQIMETFRSVATEVTLNVAEDLVKQTIEQIKSETEA